MAKATESIQNADPKTVKGWLDRNEIVLVDVRETKEFEVEHIAGALLLPLSSFDPEFFPTIPGKKLVLHCAVGKRSEAAGKMLLNEGHTDIVHMTGGMDAWKAQGFPTEIQILPPDHVEEKPQEPVFLCPAPGVVLKEEYLAPLGITAKALAAAISVQEGMIDDLLSGETRVDVEMSLRLARYFSTAADFWVHLQIEFDLERARQKIGEKLRREIQPRTASL
ncbi:MAG TPA: HigA family addiction module antitoxin [Paracoccaceae bacterium]|nr:HigA family addiction module antitoxin [Paracoccaceae bacterium]